MNENYATDDAFLLREHSKLTDDVIFAFQPQENKLLFLSAAFEKVWDMPREAVDSDLQAVLSTIHPEDRALVDNAFITIQQVRRIKRLELRLLLADGQQKWISVDAQLSQHKDLSAVVVGTATDITVYKEYGDTLYKFANKKNSILDILTHDLVSPIGNIKSSAQLLLKHAANDEELLNKMLNIIIDNSERSMKMIRDLVNKELLESSEAPLVMQRTDLLQRIAEIIEQYKRSYNTIKQKVELVTDVDNLFVTIDETKFMQVINNLLSNALKFTNDNDEIKVIVVSKETTVLIQVKDTGIGIPEELQPYVFDKFTRARRPGIHGEPTTGLGLSIIKTIIEWHNGQIWFESEVGKGTTFYIEIPKDKVD